jgi:hypothetical protein
MNKRLFYDICSSEEDIDFLLSDESTSTILDVDNENAESDEFDENNVVFELDIDDEFENWDLRTKCARKKRMKSAIEKHN